MKWGLGQSAKRFEVDHLVKRNWVLEIDAMSLWENRQERIHEGCLSSETFERKEQGIFGAKKARDSVFQSAGSDATEINRMLVEKFGLQSLEFRLI